MKYVAEEGRVGIIASAKSDGMRSGPKRARDGMRDAAVGSNSGKNTGPDIFGMYCMNV